MAIQRSARHLSAQFFYTAVAIGAVMLACQAQAAPQQQQPLFDRNEHRGNDRDRKEPAPRAQPANVGHDDRGDSHGDRGRGERDHGHDMNDRNEGPRGRPPVVRPPIHPHPPHPIIVVPPCKRGGHGITPC